MNQSSILGNNRIGIVSTIEKGPTEVTTIVQELR